MALGNNPGMKPFLGARFGFPGDFPYGRAVHQPMLYPGPHGLGIQWIIVKFCEREYNAAVRR